MKTSYKNKATEDIFNSRATKEARRTCPQSLWNIAARKLDRVDSVIEIEELRVPPGNRLELLSTNKKGQHCIRINNQYRICFKWTDNGPADVEITDYN